MGLSGVVASVAVIPAALGWAMYPYAPLPATLAVWHVAATGFIVATAATEAFAHKTQGLLGKVGPFLQRRHSSVLQRRNGKLHWLGCVLFYPYHVGLRLRHRLRKTYRDEPQFHEIVPGWWKCEKCDRSVRDGRRFVGAWPESDAHIPSGNPSVLDCTCELPRMHEAKRYLCLPAWDTHGLTEVQLQEGVEWALKQRQNGHPVYVHCAHGHGRSVAVLIACLMKAGLCQSIAEGEARIKAIRPRIRLNARQKKELVKWMQLEHLAPRD